jgi:hypothetical protein
MLVQHRLLGVRIEVDLLVYPKLRWAQAPRMSLFAILFQVREIGSELCDYCIGRSRSNPYGAGEFTSPAPLDAFLCLGYSCCYQR